MYNKLNFDIVYENPLLIETSKKFESWLAAKGDCEYFDWIEFMDTQKLTSKEQIMEFCFQMNCITIRLVNTNQLKVKYLINGEFTDEPPYPRLADNDRITFWLKT